jgi:hypothetical protein
MNKRRINWNEKPTNEVRRIVSKITNPARRHKCEVCREIFECHLCGLEEDDTHPLHWGKGRPSQQSRRTLLVCETCIDKHELFVVPVRIDNIRKTRTNGSKKVYFRDHLTGEVLR